jgi:hypothetical protein
VHIGRQIAAALAAAHACGIVHRDLKLDNLMVVPDPEATDGERIKILDFGIAKLTEGVDAGGVRTSTQLVVGTPAYMAPEQCRGASQVDGRADVYSLGIVLYELLALCRPFSGSSAGELMGRHLFFPPPSISEMVSGIPAELDSLIASLLIKDREQRPRMAQVAAHLEIIGLSQGLPGLRTRQPMLSTDRAEPMLSGSMAGDATAISLSRRDLQSIVPAHGRPQTVRFCGTVRLTRLALAVVGAAGFGLSGLAARAVLRGRPHLPYNAGVQPTPEQQPSRSADAAAPAPNPEAAAKPLSSPPFLDAWQPRPPQDSAPKGPLLKEHLRTFPDRAPRALHVKGSPGAPHRAPHAHELNDQFAASDQSPEAPKGTANELLED